MLTTSFLFFAFSGISEISTISQVIGLLLLACKAALSGPIAVTQWLRALDLPSKLLCLLLLCIFPLQSALNLLVSINPEKVDYTIALFMATLCSAIVVNQIGLKKVCEAYFYAIAIFIVCATVYDSTQLLNALRRTITDRGQVRFSPFTMHPNLTGHLLGPAIIVYIFLKSVRKPKYSYGTFINAACFALCAVCLFATSSRGATLATTAAILLISVPIAVRFVLSKGIAGVLTVVTLLIILTATAIMVGSDLVGLVVAAFELDSSRRGADSGLSGRRENWLYILHSSSTSTRGFLFGNGYRTWNVESTGVETDSSYINLLWEFGFIGLTTFVLLILLKCVCALKNSFTREESLLLCAITIFMFIESFVARYMLAVGNAASVLFLMTFAVAINKQLFPRTSSIRFSA